MVGSIGAIGVSLNLAPLLEVPSNALELLHDQQLAQCQCQCQSFPPQKLGVVPVVVTSGERKGLGRSKYFAPCIWAISSSQIVLVKLKKLREPIGAGLPKAACRPAELAQRRPQPVPGLGEQK